MKKFLIIIYMTLLSLFLLHGDEKQIKLTIEEWKEKAESGNAHAQYILGATLCEDEENIEKVKESIIWLEKSAKQGHENAQHLLGAIYYSEEMGFKDSKKAFKWFEKAADAGNIELQLFLGLYYLELELPNYKESSKWFKKAADTGNSNAQIFLHLDFLRLEPPDYKGAKKCLKKAVEQGSDTAKILLKTIDDLKMLVKDAEKNVDLQFALGMTYYVCKMFSKSEKLLKKAVSQNHSIAQFGLGAIYLEGKGIKKNIKKGIELLQQSANNGYIEAQYYLGIYYNSGVFVEKNIKKSVEYYQKAADQGHLFSMIKLGKYYIEGKIIDKDEEKGIILYKKAVSKGSLFAIQLLGDFFSDKENLKETLFWYKKGAKQDDFYSQTMLGLQYYGEESILDKTEAFKWFKKATNNKKTIKELLQYDYKGIDDLKKSTEVLKTLEKDYYPIKTMSQYYLGLCYYFGEGTKQDYKKAFKWFEIVSKKGHKNAQCYLGVCYYLGDGIKKDYKKAVEWYEKSAEQGDEDAQRRLSVCYYLGNGVIKDKTKAFIWLKKSAEQGNKASQSLLASDYYLGDGVDKDYKKAFEWAKKSANQGNEYGKEMLADFYLKGIGIEKNNEKGIEILKKLNTSSSLNELAYHYAENNLNLDDAEKIIKEVLLNKKLSGNEIACYLDTYGWVLYKQKKYKEALVQLQKSLELNANSAVVIDHLGDCFNKLKQTEKAKEQWNKALKLMKNDDSKIKLLEKICTN